MGLNLNLLNEDEKKIALQYPEFSSEILQPPAAQPQITSPQFSPEEAEIVSQYPEFAGMREKFPELAPTPIPGPRRISPVAPIPPRTIGELPERGIPGDIMAALAGGARDVAEMGLRSARVILPESAYEPEGITSKVLEELEKTDKWEIMKPSKEVVEGPWYRRWIYEGIRSALPSLTSRIGGGVAGFAGGGPIGAVAGLVAGSGLFGLSEYDRFMEEGRKAGLPEEQVRPYAIASGLTEWGGESIASIVGAKLLGVVGDRALTQPLKNTIRQMFKVPLKEGAKSLMKEMVNEVGTEIAQESLETFLRHRAGLPEEITPFEAGVSAIGPTIVMTSLFGLGAAGINRSRRNQLYKALSDPAVAAEQRKDAVLEITEGLTAQAEEFAKTDPDTSRQLATMALQWNQIGNQTIDAGQSIDIDQTIEEYLSQAQAPTPTPTEKAQPAPGPGAETPPPGPGEETAEEAPEGMRAVWYEGHSKKTRDLIQKHIEQMDELGIEASFKEAEIAARPEAGIKKTRGFHVYIPEGVEFDYDKKGNIVGIKGQAKPKEEKPPVAAPPAEAAPAPTEMPRGIIPVGEIWEKTPMDLQDEWGKASEYVERHRTEVDAQIKDVQKQIDALKGKRDKQVTAKRKELTQQLQQLKNLRETPRAEYEDLAIRQSEELGEEARKRAAARGLPEEDMDEFIEEFMMESSAERPYIEYNYKKTVNQIFDEVLKDYIEKPAEVEEVKPETITKPEEEVAVPKPVQTSAKPKTPVREASDYVKRMKNRLKQNYGAAYHVWILEGRQEGKEPEAKGLSAMAAQAVRTELDKFYLERPAPATELTNEALTRRDFNEGDTVYFKQGWNREPQTITAITPEGEIQINGVQRNWSAGEFVKTKPAPEWGSKNKVFTKERADRARETLKKKSGELRVGIDPELMQAGIDYARKMIEEAGDWIKPYLKSFYNAVRDYPGFDATGMDAYEDVAKIDVDKIGEAAKIKEGEAYGRRPEPGAVEGAGEIPLEEAPAELLPEPGEVRRPGEEGGERREVYPGRPQPGKGEVVEEGLEAPGGERGGLGAGERGMAAPEERGAGEGVRPEGRAERELLAAPEIEKPAETVPTTRNFRITPDVTATLLETGKKTKTRKNIDAIHLLKKIEEENRLATPEEQAILAQYSGWGGLPQAFNHYGELKAENEILHQILTNEEYDSVRASTPNAHYTTPDVAAWMWRALERMGFRGGRSLDPAMGTGIFEATLPESLSATTRMAGVELDSISGRISKHLYQDADIRVMGYEQTKFPNDFFDAIISNVPFGDYKVHDRTYNKFNAQIHDYFFLKSLDKARPGGMIAFITSRYSMDKESQRIRSLIAEKADLVAAFRLPFSTFQKIANTEVVTDIIFLRKKVPGQEFAGQSWMESKEIELKDSQGNVDTFHRNEYYETHPDHILGKEAATGKMYAEGMYNVEPIGNLADLLNERIGYVPEKVFAPRQVQEPSVQVQNAIPAPDYVKEGALVVVDDVIRKKQGDDLVRVDVPEKQFGKTKRLIKIRDLARQLLHSEMVDDPEETIKHDMENLNREYDRFARLFGAIRDPKNKKNLVFTQDPDYPLLLSLEEWDSAKKVASKADIFSKRVVSPVKKIEKVDTAKEALLVSLSEVGQINFPRMMGLTGKTETELQRDLAGIVFKNPEGEQWQTGDQYLSGNVREKLRISESAAKMDPIYQANVDALKAVQPEDLTFDKIDVRLGTSWLDPEDISQFTKDVLGVRGGLKIGYSPSIAMWVGEKARQTWGINSVENTETHGTPYYRGDELMIMAMNHKLPTVRLKDEEGKAYVDVAATEAAREKQYALKQRFKDWIWEDDARRERLVKKYNEEFNNLRARTFDGSHLQLPGIVSEDVIKLKPWQQDGIWRIIQTPNTLLAHVVGAGKTFTMVGAAMELRRMGIVKKPMFVVPNHILDQWGADFLKLYPNARILVAGAEDFKPLKRNVLMSRIATGDWDAVIVPHSSFFKIPMSKEAAIDYLKRQIDDLEAAIMELVAAGEDKRRSKIIKEIEKAKKRLAAKIQAKMREEEKTVNVTFEELGVDQLFIDEAHEFKNLLFATKMNRVAGISTAAADKSSDLHMKTSHLLDKYNRGVVFATGTPISNSMVEMFTMQRYLQPKTLAEYGVSHFDAWASNFGEEVPSLELAPEGKGFRVKSRFKEFINIPELLQMFHQVADVKMFEDLPGLERPAVEGGAHKIITCKPSQNLLDYVESLVARAERIRAGQVHPTEDNMLKVTNDGRKAALDMRLINPMFTSGDDAKVNKAANLITQIWKDTEKDRLTQAVFIDLSTPAPGIFNVYEDLRTKLTQMGIPLNEIAFIHDSNTKEEKQALFDRVNGGDIRVIFGSTKKMGFGTNIQTRLIAEHHMDAPWRPADIEQRDGRILRQGNTNPTVKIYRYVTEQSFDAYIWQLLENKAHSIAQVMTNRMDARRVEDIEGVTLNYAQVKALATGDPRIIEKVQTDGEVRRLEMLRQQWQANRYNIQDRLAKETKALPALERYAEDLRADIEKHKPPEKFAITIEGKNYDDRKEAGEAIQRIAGKMFREHMEGRPSVRAIGEYAGYKLVLDSSKGTERLFFKDRVEGLATISESATGTIQSLEYQTGKGLKDSLTNVERNIEETRTAIEKLKPELEKPFAQEDKLRELVKKQEELAKALDMDKGEATEQLEDEKAEGLLDEEAPKEKGEEEEGEFALYESWGRVEGQPGVFDRYGHEISGQRVEDVQKAISPILQKWHLADQVRVVQSVEEVPKAHRKPNMAAVYIRDWNKIVLVADRMRDGTDAQRRLFHEALGHFGIRKMFGSKIDPFFMQAYHHAKNRDVLVLDDIVETYQLDINTREGKLTAGSEYLARIAERLGPNAPTPTILERTYAAIRRLIRNLGFDLELTDEEIRIALAGAAKRLERGEFAPERIGAGAEYALVNPISKAFSQEGSPFDLLKNFKARYGLDIKDNDLSKIMGLFGNPWHIGRKYPAFRKLIDIELNREETREQLLHRLLANTVKGSESRVHEFLALPEEQMKKLFQLQVWCDANNEFFTKEEDLRAKARELGIGDLTKAQVSAYYAWKRTMNNAWNLLLERAEKMTFRPFENRPWFNELKVIATTKKRDLKKNPDKKKDYDAARKRIEAMDQEERRAFEAAFERVKNPANKIRRLRMEMGRIKYYVPRTREKGKYVIKVYDAEDNVIWREHAKWEWKAREIKDRLQAKYPGMEVRESIEKGIPESIFQEISDTSIQKFIERAIDRAERKEEITEKDADALRNALLESVADQLKERGFGERMIRRREGAAIGGYETEKGKKVFMDYVSGLAGFLTKQDAAFDFYKALGNINMRENTTLYEYANRYVRDMLRNTGDVDRWSGKARSLAFIYFLSGNLKMVPVQFTQNFITGIPVLGRETKKPQKKYLKAMKDVVFGHLNAEEEKAMAEEADKGITREQFVNEITAKTETGFSDNMRRILRALALPFTGAERFNRRAAALAMFRVARFEQKLSYEEALQKARDFVYDTHFLYGKANLPSAARGGTTGSALVRTALTFRSFTHNYLLLLGRSLKGKDGKIALDVLGRSLAYLALFGGLGALPFLDDLLDEWEKMFGTPVRKNIREALKGLGGEMLEKFGMAGIPALIGVDLSGSLRTGFPKLSVKGAAEEAIYGVYGGLLDKANKAMDAVARDDIPRAIEFGSPTFIENLFKAYRMTTAGATTPTGKVLFDAEGRPIVLGVGEGLGQAMGFRPEKMAAASQERRAFGNVEAHYQAKRNNLYSKFRLATSEEQRQGVLKEIERYNLEVMKYQGAIPLITRESLRKTFVQKPRKGQVRFEQLYAQ